MNKFCGKVGYATTSETKPGVYAESVVERDIIGNVIRNISRLENGSKVNQDISVNNQISIVADPEVTQNFHQIKYVTYWGISWTVNSVEVQYPRLILTLGGEYNV